MWLQADVDTLKAAVAQGVLVVTYEGPPKRSITYQSLDAMRSLLASMVMDVAAQNGRKGYILAGHSKGV